MLSVPVQGLAASTMLLCGPNHHRQQQATQAMHEHAAHGHVSHATHDAQPGTQGARGAHDTLHHPASADTGADPLGSAEPTKSKCSACASCCSAVAILGTFPSVAVADRHESRTPALTTDFEPVFIDGPERPPRDFLA